MKIKNEISAIKMEKIRKTLSELSLSIDDLLDYLLLMKTREENSVSLEEFKNGHST